MRARTGIVVYCSAGEKAGRKRKPFAPTTGSHSARAIRKSNSEKSHSGHPQKRAIRRSNSGHPQRAIRDTHNGKPFGTPTTKSAKKEQFGTPTKSHSGHPQREAIRDTHNKISKIIDTQKNSIAKVMSFNPASAVSRPVHRIRRENQKFQQCGGITLPPGLPNH